MSWEMGKSGRKLFGVAIIALFGLAGAQEGRANLVPVNSDSVVQNGIEYYIETDKVVYDLGEDVEIVYRITNLKTEVWSLTHPCSVIHVVVELREAEESSIIWAYGYACSSRPGSIRLESGESKEFSVNWAQWDSYYRPVSPGTYAVTGTVSYVIDTDVLEDFTATVDITIIPEPTSLALFAFGVAILRYEGTRRRRSSR